MMGAGEAADGEGWRRAAGLSALESVSEDASCDTEGAGDDGSGAGGWGELRPCSRRAATSC